MQSGHAATAFKYQGTCLCGAIRYEVAEFLPRIGHCHCSMCRKFHGAAFATFGEVQHENFRWLCGQSELSAYTAGNGTVRRFCRHCGSSLTFQASETDHSTIELALGTLDTDIPFRPDAHIFIAYKANWHTIRDNLQQFEEGRKQQ